MTTYLDAMFEAAYKRNHGLILNIIRKLLPASDRDNAEDLVQITFLNAWRCLQEFRGDSDIRGWLCKISANVVIDYLRQRKSQLSLSRKDYSEKDFFVDNDIVHTLENLHSWMDPHEYTFSGELQKIGLPVAQSLPGRYFAILEMREQEGLSPNEIAQIMHLTPGNVRIILFRIKGRIRGILTSPGVT